MNPVVGQASRLPLGRLAQKPSRARRPRRQPGRLPHCQPEVTSKTALRARMIANRGLGEDTMHRRMMTFRFSPFYRLGFSGAVALLTVSAWAADEKMAVLKAGSQTFTNVTVLNRTADQLCITHAGGIANVRLKDLEPELQRKFGEHPAKAEAAEKRGAEAKAKGTVPAPSPAVRTSPPGKSPPLPWEETSIDIPNQGWRVVVFTPKLDGLVRESESGNFVCRSFSESGLILSMFVEKPASGGRSHDDCFNYYWPRASRNPLIDPQSVQVEHGNRYTRVAYRSSDIPNVNYFFCFKDRWVDLHLSQPSINKGEEISLGEFEKRFRYGEE